MSPDLPVGGTTFDVHEVAVALCRFWNAGLRHPRLAAAAKEEFPGLSLQTFNEAAKLAWSELVANDRGEPRGPACGTGEITPPEHEHSAAVDLAARFLAATPPGERPKPLIPGLKAMFGLSSIEAVEAIRQSHTIRSEGA